ncbi:MAG: hypothetical protein HRT47_03275 [Candidatus Caenarcaniphilales bacterium]|nr:hypothetical protein [Candidatus Caenarcaniphilales bacterium]
MGLRRIFIALVLVGLVGFISEAAKAADLSFCEDNVEVYFPVVTNFNGSEFEQFAGESDRRPRSIASTDANLAKFPHSRTDSEAIKDCTGLSKHAGYVREFSNIEAKDYKYRVVQNFSQLEENVDKIQVLVNDYHSVNNVHNLATWVLPPNWNKNGKYTTILHAPGYGLTNNQKWFGQSNIVSYLSILRKTPNKNVIWVMMNTGGSPAMGVHPGYKEVLLETLAWGGTNLGLDAERFVTVGGSRSGHTALAWPRYLSEANYKVRGIFSNVAGSLGAETSYPFELISSHAVASWPVAFGTNNFDQWKDDLFSQSKTTSLLRERVLGADSFESAEALGMIGSKDTLVDLANQGSLQFVSLGWGVADPFVAQARIAKFIDTLDKELPCKFSAQLYQRRGHESGTEGFQDFVAGISNDPNFVLDSEHNIRLSWNGAQLCKADRYPFAFRFPYKTVINRQNYIEVVGTPGYSVEIKVFKDNQEIKTITGLMDDVFELISINFDQVGTYTFKVTAGNLQDAEIDVLVEAELPTSLEELSSLWQVGDGSIAHTLEEDLRITAECR